MQPRFIDGRLDAASADSHRLSWLRMAVAPPVAAFIALSGQHIGAAIWLIMTLAVEVVFRAVTAPARRGALSGAERRRAFAVNWLAVGVWTCPGIAFWLARSPVYHEIALGFFGGHLLYLQAHHGRSPASMLPAAPAVLLPCLLPMLFPHYPTFENLAVVGMMAIVSGHAVASALASMTSAARLDAATRALELAKQEAEITAEAMAEARAEAVAANEAKSTFLSTMSHEIRTPLNGILGMAQVMAHQDLPPAQCFNLQVIQQSGETLLAILNDLLDLSKIEAGKLELEEIEFDLDTLVRGAYATFTAGANQKGLSFSLDIDAARGTYRGDPTRLRQILYNLVSNALKFTEAGSVRVEAVYDGSALSIAVADSGIGMSEAARAGLFQSFTQADTSITRRFGGTGLGLSICKRLAELMGGDIQVESREGEGSTFRLRVPLLRIGDAAGKAPAPDIIDTAAPGFGALRVLAAEDNAVNQLVLKTLLAQIGVEPEVVGDGDAAVAAWATGPWDLILMDMQMPVMDGLSAAREIRRREAAEGLARTPIIALTANVMSHQIRDYLAAGMDNHVAKPIEAARLYETLEQTLTAAEARRRAA